MEDINDIRLEPAGLLSFADALPTIEHEIIEEPDEKGKIRSVYRQKLDGDGNPVHNAEAVEYKNRMITDVRELKLPLPSLDQIMLAFEIGRATSELQSLMRISYAVFCLQKKNHNNM